MLAVEQVGIESAARTVLSQHQWEYFVVPSQGAVNAHLCQCARSDLRRGVSVRRRRGGHARKLRAIPLEGVGTDRAGYVQRRARWVIGVDARAARGADEELVMGCRREIRHRGICPNKSAVMQGLGP